MLIVDANVAVKFVILEGGSEQARDLLDSRTPLIAPDWMLIEAAHAIWKFQGEGGVTRETAIRANEALPEFFSRICPASELLPAAIRLSYEIAHDVYDCCYLALAMREGAELLTADRKFWNAAKRARLQRHVKLFEWPGQRS